MPHGEAGELIEDLYWVRDQILAASASSAEAEFCSGDTVTNQDLRETLMHQLEGSGVC